MALTKVPGGLIADASITAADILDSTITNAKMAVDPANASLLTSGDVPLAQLGNVPDPNLSPALDDIALLAFKTQANGNLARYNLVDQSVDAFEDASGVDASASTGEVRNSSGKYYRGGTASAPTGGTVTYVGVYTVHSFLTTANFVAGVAGTADVLVVGGGGSGGGAHYDGGRGGGGGAGGVRVMADFAITAATHAATIGGTTAGGGNDANPGVDSTFMTITANGGGGGGYGSNNGGYPSYDGGDGGSGGGGGGGSTRAADGGSGNEGSFSPVEGYDGGSCGGTSNQGGGAGGGAGVVGESSSASANSRANGGDGIQNDYRTGSNVYYGGGGGGGAALANTTGGQGGGGIGMAHANNGGNATVNTGGGGGGGAGTVQHSNGGSGASGIIVIRYVTDAGFTTPSNMTLESTTTTAQAQPTKGDLVFTYSNGAGTAVVGTNITAEFSADAGSTWTNFSIAAGDTQGTSGGHTIVTKSNVTLTSTAGTSMRYRIKTLVQSASLETRIHAVSLGWS